MKAFLYTFLLYSKHDECQNLVQNISQANAALPSRPPPSVPSFAPVVRSFLLNLRRASMLLSSRGAPAGVPSSAEAMKDKHPFHPDVPHLPFMMLQSRELTIPSLSRSACGPAVFHWPFMILQSMEFTVPSPLRSADLERDGKSL